LGFPNGGFLGNASEVKYCLRERDGIGVCGRGWSWLI